MILLETHPISTGGIRQNKTRRKHNILSKSRFENRACIRSLSVYVFPLDCDDNDNDAFYPRITRLFARV